MKEKQSRPDTTSVEPLQQFADAMESELQEVDEELMRDKRLRWQKVFGKQIETLAANRARFCSLVCNESAEVRQASLELLATYHWQADVQVLLQYMGRFDPEKEVRCAAIEELGIHFAGTNDQQALAYLAQVVSRSSCRETAITAYIMLVDTLDAPEQEKQALIVTEYDGINWSLVKSYWHETDA
jgi:hypothetical protein